MKKKKVLPEINHNHWLSPVSQTDGVQRGLGGRLSWRPLQPLHCWVRSRCIWLVCALRQGREGLSVPSSLPSPLTLILSPLILMLQCPSLAGRLKEWELPCLIVVKAFLLFPSGLFSTVKSFFSFSLVGKESVVYECVHWNVPLMSQYFNLVSLSSFLSSLTFAKRHCSIHSGIIYLALVLISLSESCKKKKNYKYITPCLQLKQLDGTHTFWHLNTKMFQ